MNLKHWYNWMKLKKFIKFISQKHFTLILNKYGIIPVQNFINYLSGACKKLLINIIFIG